MAELDPLYHSHIVHVMLFIQRTERQLQYPLCDQRRMQVYNIY